MGSFPKTCNDAKVFTLWGRRAVEHLVQGVSVTRVTHAPWGNAAKMGHAQELNASLDFQKPRKSNVPKMNGVRPHEAPQGGVRGDADEFLRARLASYGDV